MLVTPSGITTAPSHEPPLVTTPLVIVYVGVSSVVFKSPVVHTYSPSMGAVACAGLRTSPDMAKTSVVNRVTSLLCLLSDFAVLANKGTPPRDSY